MAHRTAKLTPFGRRLVVERVLQLGWTAAEAARAAGISRATAYKWLRRYRQEGEAGLEGRSSRPHRSPRALPASTVQQVLHTRHHLRYGPHRLATVIRLSRSTIYAVLRRHGLARLRDLDGPSGAPLRYVRERPGELLHLDVKKLGRIPEGGGHRLLGRSAFTRRRRGHGHDYLHVAVDDASRVAYVGVYPDERGETAARFLLEAAAYFAEHGVRIERVLTDRAMAYTRSRQFADAVAALDVRHLVTRPYRPQTNGKAERFIQTMLREWAYARLYRSNDERLQVLPDWLTFYNHRRAHTALQGHTPMVILVNNLRGNHS